MHTPHNERARIMQISIHFSFNFPAKLACNARTVSALNVVELELNFEASKTITSLSDLTARKLILCLPLTRAKLF